MYYSKGHRVMTSAMYGEQPRTEQISAFSNAVVVVVIATIVLELKAPESPDLSALRGLWLIAVSYAASYLSIAIFWVNHHHPLRLVQRLTPLLIWVDFPHLFAVSLVPLATARIAQTQLAVIPVAFYAGIFICVNAAYLLFERDVFQQTAERLVFKRAKRMYRRRSTGKLMILFATSAVALIVPLPRFTLVCTALVLYLRPEAPGSGPRWRAPVGPLNASRSLLLHQPKS